MEIAVVKEPKKDIKGRKRGGSGISPPFSVLAEELYSILEA